MSNKPRKTDPNIVAALISLPSPITGKGVKKECFLKIVTSVRKDDSNIEDIITVFPTKKIRTS